jgi:hypothetical protein
VMVLLAFIGVDFGLSSVLTNVLHSLPHSRALETEGGWSSAESPSHITMLMLCALQRTRSGSNSCPARATTPPPHRGKCSGPYFSHCLFYFSISSHPVPLQTLSLSKY